MTHAFSSTRTGLRKSVTICLLDKSSATPAHAPARYGIRSGQRRHRHATDTGLPGSRIDSQHGALHEAGAGPPGNRARSVSWMSNQHLGVFLKNAALAAFLVTPVCVQAQAPERCVPAVMSLSGEGEHDVAVLDVHGEWHVLSWEGVTWIALHAPDEKARCLARQLLLGGSNVRSDSADTRCTGDWGNFMRIVSTDPLIRACGAVPSCTIGDTCS